MEPNSVEPYLPPNDLGRQNTPLLLLNGHDSPRQEHAHSAPLLSVSQVAEKLNLRSTQGGWIGPNPSSVEGGAQTDGFVIYAAGNAWDRKLDRSYSCKEVAQLAGIPPESYEPYVDFLRVRKQVEVPLRNSNSTTTDTSVTPKPKPQAAKVRSLEERGIRPETQILFKIRQERNCCAYPTFHADGTSGRGRWKNARQGDASTPKYKWVGDNSVPMPSGYNLNNLNGAKKATLVGGEVDVWTAQQTGLTAVSTFGEMQGHSRLMEDLQQMGVESIQIVLDNDEAGHKGALMALDTATAIGMHATVHVLDGPKGFDVNDLYVQVGCDDATFREVMASLPEADSATLEQWRSNNKVAVGAPPPATPQEVEMVLSIKLPHRPSPPRNEVFNGIIGELVEAILPHTEADPIALAGHALTAFGNMVGRGPRAPLGNRYVYTNMFMAFVGRSSRGRKGTAWEEVKVIYDDVDPEWTRRRIISNLPSGEALIDKVRDPLYKDQQVQGKDGKKSSEPVLIDQGVLDKRLMILQTEMAFIFEMNQRQGNTFSSILRDAWDNGRLSNPAKNSPAHATGAHVSMAAHITEGELRARLTQIDAANGFANRFLFLSVERSKLLSLPKPTPMATRSYLVQRLQNALTHARNQSELEFSGRARERYDAAYAQLTSGSNGLKEGILSRAEAQVLRLSLIYALLDSSAIIDDQHVEAALALWDFSRRSAEFIFGNALGNNLAERILDELQGIYPQGRTSTQLWNLLGRNTTSSRLADAVAMLVEHGLVRQEKTYAGVRGRPTQLWFAIPEASAE